MSSFDQAIPFLNNVSQIDLIKILVPAVVTFAFGIMITPVLTHYMYRYQLWKKRGVKKTIDGRPATISNRLHNDEAVRVPRMGGLVVVISVVSVALLFRMLAWLADTSWAVEINYLNRSQTWIPLVALVLGAGVGLIDDLAVVGRLKNLVGKLGQYAGDGLSLKTRLLAVATIAAGAGYWFYQRLDIASIQVPFYGELHLGFMIIVLFIVVAVATYSGGIIDGIDGLSGGIFVGMFSTYTMISFLQYRFDLAALTMAISGGLLAFLWFNIPPARFYLSEVGTMSLTTTLAIVAFITDTVLLLPIIAFPLLITSLSSQLQILSKKFRSGKKVFLVAPLHNHFQALGWPGTKVTMRYWIFGLICQITGLVVFLLGYQLS